MRGSVRGSFTSFDTVAGVVLVAAFMGIAVANFFPTAFQSVAHKKFQAIATAVDAATGQVSPSRSLTIDPTGTSDFGQATATDAAKRRKNELSWAFLEGCWEASPTIYQKAGNRHITCFRARAKLNVVYLHYANRGYTPEPTDCSYASTVRLISGTRMILESNMDRLGLCSNANAAGRRIGYSVELSAPDLLVDHTLTRILMTGGSIKEGERITYSRLKESEDDVRKWFPTAPIPTLPIS